MGIEEYLCDLLDDVDLMLSRPENVAASRSGSRVISYR